jgi:hypothetical protein
VPGLASAAVAVETVLLGAGQPLPFESRDQRPADFIGGKPYFLQVVLILSAV